MHTLRKTTDSKHIILFNKLKDDNEFCSKELEQCTIVDDNSRFFEKGTMIVPDSVYQKILKADVE